jgi:predicted adenine nucleotide alpha hydrolase (AANH) superfamily ATPase
MKKILLHICCAPCSASAVETLKKDFEISFYWHNPNIWNTQEYENRKYSAQRYAEELEIDFLQEKNFSYNYENWKSESLEQCALCYKLRLTKTAEFAKRNKFDFWTTSLLSSPHQKHDLIKTISDKLSNEYSSPFLYKDFRPGFYEDKNLLGKKGYYMQKYCACEKSYNERNQRK